MSTTTYAVTGMTCDHCVRAVTNELTALDEVRDVSINLVADGVSTVTVTSTEQLTDEQIDAAFDEAGDYQLVPTQ